MEKIKTFYFHQDAGHGWLAVPRKELKALGILTQISGYSYQKGQTVYLEEDIDAQIFLDAYRAKIEATIKDDIIKDCPIILEDYQTNTAFIKRAKHRMISMMNNMD